MAADLAARGYHVNLWNRTFEHIETIKSRGGIELQLEQDQFVFGKLQVISNRVEEVIDDVHLIMVVVPASAHANIAKLCAPYLKDEQIMVLGFVEDGRIVARDEYPAIVAPACRPRAIEVLKKGLLGSVHRQSLYAAMMQVAFGASMLWFLSLLGAMATEKIISRTTRSRNGSGTANGDARQSITQQLRYDGS